MSMQHRMRKSDVNESVSYTLMQLYIYIYTIYILYTQYKYMSNVGNKEVGGIHLMTLYANSVKD